MEAEILTDFLRKCCSLRDFYRGSTDKMKERIYVTAEVETVRGASTSSKRRRDADGKGKTDTVARF